MHHRMRFIISRSENWPHLCNISPPPQTDTRQINKQTANKQRWHCGQPPDYGVAMRQLQRCSTHQLHVLTSGALDQQRVLVDGIPGIVQVSSRNSSRSTSRAERRSSGNQGLVIKHIITAAPLVISTSDTIASPGRGGTPPAPAAPKAASPLQGSESGCNLFGLFLQG